MKALKKDTALVIFLSIFIISIAVFSYKKFSGYKPKKAQGDKTGSVAGASYTGFYNLLKEDPLYQKSKLVSKIITANGYRTVFETSESAEKISKHLSLLAIKNGFGMKTPFKYQKNDEVFEFTIIRQSGNTPVFVEINTYSAVPTR